MNNRFQGKVALVTGAAQGIGRGVCWRLKAEGAQVVAVDRSELVHELAGEGMLTLTADLEQHADCARVMASAVETHGRLDILVNNVGGTIWAKPFEHYEVEQIEAEVRRSLFPTLWCCHAALPYMLERGSGVDADAPAGGTEAPPRRVPRNSAEQTEQEKRWYQQIVDQTLDSSLMHRYGSIDEQVGAILFLASDEASYITGVTLPVGGGDLG
jgi:dihydroxycyclohexadiene carboxylate dehydrogenase